MWSRPLLLLFSCLVLAASGTASPDSAVVPSQPALENVCSEGDIAGYADLIENSLERGGALEADERLEKCLAVIAGRPDGIDRLLDLRQRSASHVVGAKITLLVASRYLVGSESCRDALIYFAELEREYPGTEEATRGSVARAMQCFTAIGRDDLAIRDLEKVVGGETGGKYRAWALYELGQLYRWQERRELARRCFERLIREYPREVQYPDHDGVRLVEHSEDALAELDRYELGPVYDKILFRAKRTFGIAKTPLDLENEAASESATAGVVLALRIWWLCVTIALFAVVRRFLPGENSGRGALFRRAWSLLRIAGVLVTVWLISFLGELLASAALRQGGGVFLWRGVVGILCSGVLVGLSVWGESPRELLRIDRRRIRAVVCVAVLCVGVYAVAAWGIQGLARGFGEGHRVVERDLAGRSLGEGGARWPVILGALLGALGEEVFFRGAVYEALRRSIGRWSGAAVTSILFATVHILPLPSTFSLIVFGLLCAALRERFGSLLPPIMLHGAVSLIALAR